MRCQFREGAGEIETSEMVREVGHGMPLLVQRQQRAMNNTERKYDPVLTTKPVLRSMRLAA